MGLTDGILRGLGRLLTGSFFDRVDVIGAEQFPANGPVLVVANHPNSLIDGVLLASHLPRYSKLVAASTVWNNRALVPLLSAAGVIPVYRRHEVGAVAGRNEGTFHAAIGVFADQGVVTMFPEGQSHNADTLQPLKKGAARMALSALDDPAAAGLKIVPVAILYEDKTRFRSGAGLCVGAPIDPSRFREPAMGDVARLTKEIRDGMEAVLAQACDLRGAEPWAEAIDGKIVSQERPASAGSGMLTARRMLASVSIAMAALPNGIPWILSRRFAEGKDLDKRATWSLFASVILFPVAWIAFALLALGLTALIGGSAAEHGRLIALGSLVSGPLTATLAVRMWRWRPAILRAAP